MKRLSWGNVAAAGNKKPRIVIFTIRGYPCFYPIDPIGCRRAAHGFPSSGRSSDSRISPLLRLPIIYTVAFMQQKSPITAAGPFPIFTEFPIKPFGTGQLCLSGATNPHRNCQANISSSLFFMHGNPLEIPARFLVHPGMIRYEKRLGQGGEACAVQDFKFLVVLVAKFFHL